MHLRRCSACPLAHLHASHQLYRAHLSTVYCAHHLHGSGKTSILGLQIRSRMLMLSRLPPLNDVYAMMSFFSLVMRQKSIYFSSIRDIYEAWVIYNFLSLCLAWVGGPGAVVTSLSGRLLKPSWHLMTCCLPAIPLDGRFIRRCKQGGLQFVILKPILVAVTFFLYSKNKYEDGNFSANQGYLYITIIYTISYSLALYALVLFYVACKDLLRPFKPVPKFAIIKSVVFLTYWQGVLVFLAAKSGFIKNSDDAADVQNFIICVEMAMAAVGHLYAFPYKEYAEANIGSSGGLGDSITHALNFNDFYYDTVHQILDKDSGQLRIPYLQTDLGRVLRRYATQIHPNRIELRGYRPVSWFHRRDKSLFPIEVSLGQFGLEDTGNYNLDTRIASMADRIDDVTEEVSSSQGQQTHEVGESSRPPQTEDEIFRTQLVTALAMFTQVMRNPRFMAFLQPLPPSQSNGYKKQKSEPAKAQPQVIHSAVLMETPVHMPETMQSPNPVHNAQKQVAGMPILQAAPIQPATFQQPLVGPNGQGSDLQAMQQVFPPPSIHPGYFGGGSVFQSMAGHAPGNQFHTPRILTVSMYDIDANEDV
ncbi:hypothetical protein L7F22_049845 [Adiantum nelumboides]|nr:hypothetical protein [Adiantum nelumboides]